MPLEHGLAPRLLGEQGQQVFAGEVLPMMASPSYLTMPKPVNMEKFLRMINDLEQHWQKDIILPRSTDAQGTEAGSE